ncbi:hypothetical protein D3C84_519190 [compost metagenome]
MTASGAGAFQVVGGRTVASARAGAVEVLAPEQEFDRVVAGGDVGFGTAQLVEAGEFFRGDVFDVDLVFADLNFGVGDDVGGGARVTQSVLVGFVDVVDQTLVQRPGVNLTFPIVDDGVAEAEHFALQVRNARGDPGSLGGFQGVGVGLGEEGVNGGLQGFRGGFGVAVNGEDHVGVVCDHSLGGGFVDFTGSGRRRRRCGGAGGWGRCGRSGGLVFAFAATGEGNSDGQQTGGSQRHTNHGEHPASIGVESCYAHAKLRHNANLSHYV